MLSSFSRRGLRQQIRNRFRRSPFPALRSSDFVRNIEAAVTNAVVRPLFRLLLVAACLLVVSQPAAAQPLDSGTVKLFDGESLKGFDANPEHWRVENGAIVGEIKPGETLRRNTWLIWRGGEVSDFELHAQFRLTGAPGANSGIQFRCQAEDVEHVAGYQADLDLGPTWLGRIYDEEGRALLVERGSRVHIAADGTRRVQTFAPAHQYAVLFRENAWNDYRIVAIGSRVDVYVNGTLFSQLQDDQTGEQDLQGLLAFQLHSGGETKIEFRDLIVERLAARDRQRLTRFEFASVDPTDAEAAGVIPLSADGQDLNLGFERGSLTGWTATGDAFNKQPVEKDGIASRWAGQVSNKDGNYFIGGFEIVRDAGTGTLTSSPFPVTHPYASFLIGGGSSQATRVELLSVPQEGEPSVVFSAVGDNREQMRRVVADLREMRGVMLAVRLVDESAGGWGHLNFDDFRFHERPPAPVEPSGASRSTFNPLLNHLVPNPVESDKARPGSETVSKMFVPEGFSVDVVAAEPNLHQPMAFTFDARGRLWVVEGHSYPQKRPEGEGLDRVLIFSDEDGDGNFETRKVFTEGLNLVSGMEVGYGGVWIGAAPQLLFIPDKDGDDKPDGPPQVLLDGFGYADTHETLNSFMWGPDGWLYGNQGVFNKSMIGKPGAADADRKELGAGVWRYHPTRHVFEIFAHGGSNQWGLDYDEHGQIFMTHCRSFWGEGLTTHVMQGGNYWNQVNGGYAPFISAKALPGLPLMKNYLLASARYGHGEGGAGKAGSREVYGGHSHVGTMIYLGTNWPAEYRNQLFTHNLHGHQLNRQINQRLAGGYNTVHAGSDMLFCSDPQYIGVDLKVGPDGAVYISDWYDPRLCHNPNVELWDRGNGRMYRMKFDATYKPVSVNYHEAYHGVLVAVQLQNSDWDARMGRLELSERAAAGQDLANARRALLGLTNTHPDELVRLRCVLALHAIGRLDDALIGQLLKDESEYVRGWVIQLACELEPSPAVQSLLIQQAQADDSLLVRRYLASALQRLPAETAWQVAATLISQPENAADRDLPLLIWQGMAHLVEMDLPHGLQLADATQVPAIADYLLWYSAKLSEEGRDRLAERLAAADAKDRPRLLALFAHAVRDMRGLAVPAAWSQISESLYDSPDAELRAGAETLGAAFADAKLFERLRSVLANEQSSNAAKTHALSLLANDPSPENYPLFLRLIDNPQLAPQTLPLLSRFDQSEVAPRVLERLPNWQGATNDAALELLSGRVAWANQLLDAVAAGKLEKSRLTAYYARQMANLGNAALNDRLAKEWGNVTQSSAQLLEEITKTENAYKTAPLWAYEARVGAQHFKKLCANCHQPDQPDERIAPKLEGIGSKGIDYAVENVIDPNAVIGRDFQARVIQTVDGQVLTGLVQSETASAITLRTQTNTVTIKKSDVEEMAVSENSFMPSGLLETLNERERIELFKYLMGM